MTTKSKKKSAVLFMVFTMMLSFLSPISSFAQSATDAPAKKPKKELIKKADPFVYLDDTSETFKVEKKAKKVLSKDELKKVKEIIKDTNEKVKKYRSDLVIEGEKFSGKMETSQSEGQIQTASIDHSEAFDYDFTWWGLKMYWSHAFVKELEDNTLAATGGTTITWGAMHATLLHFGYSPPAWLGSFITGIAAISLWAFTEQDEGCGVYLDCYMYVPTRWYSAC